MLHRKFRSGQIHVSSCEIPGIQSGERGFFLVHSPYFEPVTKNLVRNLAQSTSNNTQRKQSAPQSTTREVTCPGCIPRAVQHKLIYYFNDGLSKWLPHYTEVPEIRPIDGGGWKQHFNPIVIFPSNPFAPCQRTESHHELCLSIFVSQSGSQLILTLNGL
jgi:hypothetical protein